MSDKKLNEMSPEELDKFIKERVAEKTKFWTEEDHDLINMSMKNIFDLSVEQAVYQARKWAFLEARASVVKIENEADRKVWFDEEISTIEYTDSIMKANKKK